MLRTVWTWIYHILAVALLTALTQLGGLAWLISLPFRRRWLVFVGVYLALSLAALFVAPIFGRSALPCFGDSALQAQSPLYCVLNRQYVTPELHDLAKSVASGVEQDFPGTITLVLDGNFPFFDGFPLLPHLSHDDGLKLDLAFYYRDMNGYLPSATRSPIGYFAFEQGQTDCPDRFPSMRWNLEWLQPLMRDLELDESRTKRLVELLLDDARVEMVFMEPHLSARLGVSQAKLRFQGCRAARHDDHIHVQIRADM